MAKISIEDSMWLLGHCLISNPSWVGKFSFCEMRLRYTERVMAFVRRRSVCGMYPEVTKNTELWISAQKPTPKPGSNVGGATDC